MQKLQTNLKLQALSYAAEVAEPKLRGSLSSTSTLFICIGILFSFIAGTFLVWRTVALIFAVAPLVSFFILLLIPETPYWLLTKNKVDQARNSLAWFRGCYHKSEVKKLKMLNFRLGYVR